MIKPLAGWKANAYVIFDYQGPNAFKFAGIDISVNKLVMGHRDASGWIVDVQIPFQAKADLFYNMLLSVNGLTATLVVNNQATLTYTFAPTVIDGFSYGAQLRLRRLRLGQLPRQHGQRDRPDPAAAVHLRARRGLRRRRRRVRPGLRHVERRRRPLRRDERRLAAGPRPRTTASGPTRTSSSRRRCARARSAGIAFDAYAANDYKFAALDVAGQRVLIGHVDPRRGFVIDASVARALVAGADDGRSRSRSSAAR